MIFKSRIYIVIIGDLGASHYANTPMQYTAKFHGCKNGHFHMKNCDIFLIFAQNIDCGYTLEPPHLSMFWSKNKKKCKPM